jgi:quaternary ammonium compound-resistance protein SugE
VRPWLFLLAAGLLEVVWAGALKRASEPPWLALTAVALVGSTALLALAVRQIPLGTAYAVWVGIGIVGTAVVSVVAYGERFTPAQWFFLALVAIGVVGTKLATPAPP